jgi:hypothetical protein
VRMWRRGISISRRSNKIFKGETRRRQEMKQRLKRFTRQQQR